MRDDADESPLIQAGNNSLHAVRIEAAQRLIRLDPRWFILGRSLRSLGSLGERAT